RPSRASFFATLGRGVHAGELGLADALGLFGARARFGVAGLGDVDARGGALALALGLAERALGRLGLLRRGDVERLAQRPEVFVLQELVDAGARAQLARRAAELLIGPDDRLEHAGHALGADGDDQDDADDDQLAESDAEHAYDRAAL